MEGKRIKKGSSLKWVFVHYLFAVTASVIGVVFLMWCLVMAMLWSGFLLPANHWENMATQYVKAIEEGEKIDTKKIPDEIGYVVWDNTKKAVSGSNCIGKKREELLKLAKNENASTNMHYMRVSDERNTYVFTYYISADFASKRLRSLFPHMEWTLFCVFLIVLILDIIGVSLHYAKSLQKKVNVMKNATEKIKEKNLEFCMEYTGTKEFDEVLSSLEQLKSELASSLSEQWALEQQTRQQMGALAHDIKTPLTIMKGNAELLGESELDEDQTEYLTYILGNIEKMQTYVTKLIEISKGKPESLKREKIKTEEFFSLVEKEVAPMLATKKMKFEMENKLTEPSLYLDIALCLRAISNLVDNALQYSKEGGTISFLGWQDLEYICFAVLDEGRGFSGEELKHATKEFYRANPNRNAVEHFGLGLSIAKNIAKLHGGDLQLANTKKGAMVTLRLSRIEK